MVTNLQEKDESKSERVKRFFCELNKAEPFRNFSDAWSRMTEIMDKIEKEAYEASQRRTPPMRVPKYDSWNYNANFSWIRSAYTTKQVIFISWYGAIAIYRLIIRNGIPVTDPAEYANVQDERTFLKPNIFGKNVWDK